MGFHRGHDMSKWNLSTNEYSVEKVLPDLF